MLKLDSLGREHRQVRRFRTERERDAWVMAGANRRAVSRRDISKGDTPTHVLRTVRFRVGLHDRLAARAEKSGRSFDSELQRILEVVLGD